MQFSASTLPRYKPTDARHAQPAIGLHLRNHCAQGINMRRKHEWIPVPTQVNHDAALVGNLWIKPKL